MWLAVFEVIPGITTTSDVYNSLLQLQLCQSQATSVSCRHYKIGVLEPVSSKLVERNDKLVKMGKLRTGDQRRSFGVPSMSILAGDRGTVPHEAMATVEGMDAGAQQPGQAR